METGFNWGAAVVFAGILGGGVATIARLLKLNRFVPIIAVLSTTLANVWLVVKAFMAAAGAPVAWLEWAPPSEGNAMAYAGWGFGNILSVVIALLTALKVQYPAQKWSFERGETAVLFPNRVPEPVVTQTVTQAETEIKAKS